MADRRAFRTAAAAIGVALAGCAAGGGAPSSAQQARFESGNEAYERGAYEEAATIYEDLLSAGVDAAAIQYNLGSALYKGGRMGPAILAFERALRIDPRDPDARANLEYLRTLTTDRITEAASPLTALGLVFVMDLTSPDQDATVFVVAWLLAGGAGALFIASGSARARKIALYAAAACAVPVLFAGASLGAKAYLGSTRVEGIVLASDANVLSGAGEGNPTLFTVHEGLKVRVHGRTGDWVQVSLANGLAGWLPASAVEEI